MPMSTDPHVAFSHLVEFVGNVSEWIEILISDGYMYEMEICALRYFKVQTGI